MDALCWKGTEKGDWEVFRKKERGEDKPHRSANRERAQFWIPESSSGRDGRATDCTQSGGEKPTKNPIFAHAYSNAFDGLRREEG